MAARGVTAHPGEATTVPARHVSRVPAPARQGALHEPREVASIRTLSIVIRLVVTATATHAQTIRVLDLTGGAPGR